MVPVKYLYFMESDTLSIGPVVSSPLLYTPNSPQCPKSHVQGETEGRPVTDLRFLNS